MFEQFQSDMAITQKMEIYFKRHRLFGKPTLVQKLIRLLTLASKSMQYQVLQKELRSDQ